MPDFSFVLYDTALFGTSANTEHTLFQAAQGSSSTLTKVLTNSRGAGQLPQEESFLIEEIGIFLDLNTTAADYQNVFVDSYIEIRISDKTVFQSPLRLCAKANAFAGHYSQATAADDAAIGLLGDGFKLKKAIEIPGGTSFRVTVYQGTAMAGASSDVRVCLIGTLGQP